jgi:hypothetical protein
LTVNVFPALIDASVLSVCNAVPLQIVYIIFPDTPEVLGEGVSVFMYTTVCTYTTGPKPLVVRDEGPVVNISVAELNYGSWTHITTQHHGWP